MDDAPVPGEQERRKIADAWNRTATDYPRDQTVAALFEQQVLATPDAIAVEYAEQGLCYARLNHRSNQLAHYLRSRGVGAEVRVGVFMQPGVDMIVALLGILKAGGAYLPLDPDYPDARLEYMLEDARAPVLLSRSKLGQRLPGFAGERVCLDRDWAKIEQEKEHNPEAVSSADSLAYVVYTSGSTGTPKGVEIPHRAINRLVRNTNYYQVDASDRIAQVSNVSFDAATFEIWGALLNGARLVGIGKETLLEPNSLAALLREKGITAMFVTTAVFNQIAREAPASFGGLRALLFGGEAVDCDAVRRVLANHPPERLLHVYGPTESTTFASWYRIEAVPADAATVPIGWPLANTTLYVLDQKMNPVPAGVPGELYIGGDGLARGYLDRAELTAERFVADPFAAQAEARLYRTGDKVRYRPDGAIEFIGRYDRQIKLRGFRIEPGEIESALLAHAEIRDAVVSVMPGASGEQQLVAHIVMASGRQIEAPQRAPDLGGYLRQRLPGFMVPSVFLPLEKLPLTPNGKVDRQALLQTASGRLRLSTDYEKPRTPFEIKLAAIWRQVLKIEQIGINDNFFELGGDSLTGAVLINALQDALGVRLYVVALFEAPTIAELIRYLEKHFPQAVAASIESGNGRGVEKPGAVNDKGETGPLDPGDIAEFRKLAAGWHRGNHSIKPWTRRGKPGIAYILTTPRSGSSLLRIMLAGHPRLFAPPELELLPYDSLRQRRERLSGGIDFMREGLIRAVMAIKNCEADEAQRIIADHEKRDESVQAFHSLLLEWIGDRMLVDKSATYPMSPQTLARAEQSGDGNLYIHLVRHPLGTICSFEEARLDRVLKFQDRHRYSARQFAELLWIICHQNILDFLSGVAPQRQLQIRFEDLVRNPRPVIENICNLLGISFDPLLLDPYRQQERRMTDGINALSVGMTDAKFHQYSGINAAAADAWRRIVDTDFLSAEAWRLAALFGYERLLEGPAAITAGGQSVPTLPAADELSRLTDEEIDRRLQVMLAAQREN